MECMTADRFRESPIGSQDIGNDPEEKNTQGGRDLAAYNIMAWCGAELPNRKTNEI